MITKESKNTPVSADKERSSQHPQFSSSLLRTYNLKLKTFFSGDTRRNTRGCRAHRVRRPPPRNRRRESDRNHRNLRLTVRFSALRARNEQTAGVCRGRFPACYSGYP